MGWCPNASSFAIGVAQSFYPGDNYVDWISGDAYNWSPGRSGATWRSFKDSFAAFYAWGAPKAAPLMVGETGVMERDPAEKAAWIADMGNTLKVFYPEIKALVYFDAYSTANFGGWYDWRMDTSASAYEAFRALGQDPYFNGGGQTVVPLPDTVAPSPPQQLNALTTASRIDLTWASSTDDVAVTGYDVYRDGFLVATSPSTSYSDTAVAQGTTYVYTVQARDAAGNASASSTPLTVTIPAVGAPLFSEGFESGTMSAWTSSSSMVVGGADPHSGAWAAEASSSNSRAFAIKTLPTSLSDMYVSVWFKVTSQNSTMNLLRVVTASGANVATLFVSAGGDLMMRNDTRGTNIWSSSRVSKYVWHQIQVRFKVSGSSGLTEVWYDFQPVTALSTTQNLGTTSLARLIVGDNVNGRSYRVLFDDVAVSNAPSSNP